MTISPLSLPENYWSDFKVSDNDLEFLYNHLLEIELPRTPEELLHAIVEERIRQEKRSIENRQQENATIYLPKNQYEKGQKLLFPILNWSNGEVIEVRKGNNPDVPPFDVIKVLFSNGEIHHFAAKLQDHILNNPVSVNTDDPNLDINKVLKKYGRALLERLTNALETSPDLVRIAGRWFPRALLVDVNIGHLNLAEALLEMEGGGPLSTRSILDQIELPTDVNPKLTEFSLNLALQEDGRFDEVGSSGEVLWFLRRLEPDNVKITPHYLRYQPIQYDKESIKRIYELLQGQVVDELEPFEESKPNHNKVVISLIFPHWKAGTLPFAGKVTHIIPGAIESPRVRFTFIDGESGDKFSGWVVRPEKYVYGLAEWYNSQSLIPGSIVHVERGSHIGEIIVRAEKRRSTREWIRTALIGVDGGIVFAMLKQPIAAGYDEHMTIAIPDLAAIDQIWSTSGRQKPSLEEVVIAMMRELSKLNPQGHIHAQELYAAVNIVRRCPPGPILNLLTNRSWASYIGDLYFRLNDAVSGESS